METADAYEWRICLTHLLDPTVSEVAANGPESFFIKKSGKRIHLSEIKLPSEARYTEGVEAGLLPFTRALDAYEPNTALHEAPLYLKTENGVVRGRVHIALPPMADVPLVTIAKKSTSLTSLDVIASKGSMAVEMMEFLKASMKASLTVAFSGGTGAGKTTMLEACTRLIPHQYRIGVAEDTPELTLEQPNVPYMHSYPWKPGMEEKDVATLDFVVSQVQRMRTDRIIVGETRGKEFASFLIAANSGMEGSLTTIHANSPRECLSKMTNFALRGSERQPVRSVNTDISTAIDLIIQLVILPDGRYKMASISEVTKGLSDKESADITISELYRYDHGKDIFIKGAQMSDALRRKLEVKGVDVAFFQTQRPGAILHTPSEVPENEGPRVLPKTSERSGGLPRPGRRSGQ